MKTGKLPADAITGYPRLSALVDLDYHIPRIPARFGHMELISDWGMNGNDRWGDCAWAMAAHQVRYWNIEASRAVAIGTTATLSDYAAATGFNPNDPSTDQGTQMADLVRYWKNTGIVDDTGARHKIAAAMRLQPGNIRELFAAVYLFGGASIGIEFADYLEDEFNAGQPWTYRTPYVPSGGHAIPIFARQGELKCVTWGREQPLAMPFYEQASDEGWVLLSQEMLDKTNKSIEGFDGTALAAMMPGVAQLR